jgi:dihydrofolate reductase
MRSSAGEKDVLVAGGADAVQQALETGLLDELQIHLVPVFLGTGVPLLDRIAPDTELELDRVVDAPGVTHLRYRVIK